MTIAVAMSGGVDSSTVAAMLKAEGHNLVGLGRVISNPPAIVPIRMARNVPPSTYPFAVTSSSFCTSWGRMLYFTGPKKAAWVPSRNSIASMNGTCSPASASPAAAMRINSAALSICTRRVFSNRSTMTPAVAENRKNGSIKRPPPIETIVGPLYSDKASRSLGGGQF